jgi:hypothetical protein
LSEKNNERPWIGEVERYLPRSFLLLLDFARTNSIVSPKREVEKKATENREIPAGED